MIRGKPKFAWLWPTEQWVVRARALERGQRGLWEAAKRLVERRIDKASRDRFLAAVSGLVDDTIVPELATALQTSLPEDTTERRIIRAMVRRDYLYAWLISPYWRARLSYQQLIQSRTWVRRIARGADPLAQPFIVNVCKLETAIKEESLRYIGETFNPALVENIETLADELRGGSERDRVDLVTYFVFERLRGTVLETAVDAYDEAVR